MEPEKIIGEKILFEELTPIRWQKDRVWQNIPREKQPRRVVLYGAAAFLVLATFPVVYFFQSEMDQKMQERITSLESKIKGFNTESPIESIAYELPIKVEACEGVAEPDRDFHQNKIRPELVQISMTEIIPVKDEEEIPPMDSTLVVRLETEPAEELPTIEAIIGVIPAQQQPVRTAKVKKSERLHFNFSREQKDFFSTELEKHSLTARIN